MGGVLVIWSTLGVINSLGKGCLVVDREAGNLMFIFLNERMREMIM